MSPIVFLDTETTGLKSDDEIWEFAAIRREDDGTEVEHHIFIEHDRKKCRALPESFRTDHYNRYLDHLAYTPQQASLYIGDIFRNGKPHVVGAVPNFDTERIERLIGYNPGWHYHLIDVENLAVGYLLAQGHKLKLPWVSDTLGALVGVTITEQERHTALGDARWAMRIFDAVTGCED